MTSDTEIKRVEDFVTSEQISEVMDSQTPGELDALLTPFVNSYYKLYMSCLENVDSRDLNDDMYQEIKKLDLTFSNYIQFGFVVRMLEDVVNQTGTLGARADAVEVATGLLRHKIFQPQTDSNPHLLFPTTYSDSSARFDSDDIRTFDTSFFENIVDRLIILDSDGNLPEALHSHAHALLQTLKESYWKIQYGEPYHKNTEYKTIETRPLFSLSKKEVMYFGLTKPGKAVY